MVFLLGLGAAVLLALGFVVQQHAAALVPPDRRLSPRILVDLARRPVWLGGIAAMIGGQVLGAIALGRGSLTLVEPLLSTNLLFALPMAAAWTRKRLGRREWTGAVVLVAGLATFVAAGAPGGPQATRVVPTNWLIAGLSIVAVVATLTWFAKRSDLGEEATLLAAGAGLLYGLQDALTQRTLLLFHRGWGVLLTAWQPYSLVAVAITGLMLAQSAFEAAPLAASLPALTIAEPICGIGLGAGLFAQELRLSGQALGLELAGILAMLVGVYLVARSPLVTGELVPIDRDTSRAA